MSRNPNLDFLADEVLDNLPDISEKDTRTTRTEGTPIDPMEMISEGKAYEVPDIR